jgi:hypothetical protein
MPPSTGAPITWDGELPRLAVERFTLASGLEVVVHTDRASPMVAVWMGYRVGSSDEGDGDSGFAHLFEHMFKNSLHLGGRHHYQILREAGAIDANAQTGTDRTVYHETVPQPALATALWIEADRMGFFLPGLDDERLRAQIAVVQSERRQRYENAPYGPERFAAAEALYPDGHPLRYLTIGRHAGHRRGDRWPGSRRSTGPGTCRPTRPWCWPATSTATRPRCVRALVRRLPAVDATAAAEPGRAPTWRPTARSRGRRSAWRRWRGCGGRGSAGSPPTTRPRSRRWRWRGRCRARGGCGARWSTSGSGRSGSASGVTAGRLGGEVHLTVDVRSGRRSGGGGGDARRRAGRGPRRRLDPRAWRGRPDAARPRSCGASTGWRGGRPCS